MKKSVLAIMVLAAVSGVSFSATAANMNVDSEGTWSTNWQDKNEGGYNNGLRNPYCKDNNTGTSGADGCTQNHKNDEYVQWGEMQGIVADIRTLNNWTTWNNEHIKAAEKDIDQNTSQIEKNEKRFDSMTELMFGGTVHLDNEGNFDGFLRAESDELNVGADGTIYGYWSDAGLYGKARLWAEAADIEMSRLDDTKADKTDVEAIDGRVTTVEGKITTVENGAKTIIANKDLIINKVGEKVEGAKTEINNAIDNKIEIAKGDVQTSIDNSITNIVTGGNTEINAKWEGAKEKANDFDERITANKNRIDDQATRIGKVEDLSAQNKKDIGTLNKETKRLDNVKADKVDLEALEAKGNDAYGKLDGRVTKVEGDVVNLNGKVDNAITVGGDRLTTVEGDVATINGKISKVENAGNTLIQNAGDIKATINAKLGDKYEEIRTDITNEIDNTINAKVEGAKTTIINNKEGIKGNIELAYNGAKTDITNNVLNEIKAGDNSIVVDIKQDIKNEIDNSITNAGKDFTARIDSEVSRGESEAARINARIDAINHGTDTDLTAIREAIGVNAEGIANNAANIEAAKTAGVNEAARLEDKKADKADLDKAIADGTDALTNLNGKVDTNIELGKAAITRIDNSVTDLQNDLAVVTGDINYVKDNAQTWVDNGKTYVDNTVNTAIDNKVTDIKSNISNTWEQNKVEVINNAQVKLENYTNNVKGDIINEINTSIENNGKDFQDQIDYQVGRGEKAAGVAVDTAKLAAEAGKTESAFLRDTKADKAELDRLQKELDDAIDNAYSKEDIDNAIANYKLKVRAKIEAAKPGAEDALQAAKDKAKKEANVFVKNEINNAIEGNKDIAITYVKDSIDEAMKDAVAGGQELADRITKVEGQINTAVKVAGKAKEAGKDAAKVIAAKAPAIKGDVAAKVNNAKTYVKSIDAKADTAISMGHQNAQDIVTERNDRIQGQRDTLKAANNYTDNKFNSLKNTVEQNRRKAAAGVAGVAAMSNIPALTGDANGSFGMGLGHYDGAQSISAGVQQRFNQNVVGKASFASDDHGNVVVGIGASVQW